MEGRGGSYKEIKWAPGRGGGEELNLGKGRVKRAWRQVLLQR
jgi:hypothetical protein